MEVSKDLKNDIERNQNQLKIAIKNHQTLIMKLKSDPDNVDLKYKIKNAQNEIISIGLDQRDLIERLRRELKIHQKNVKQSVTKTGLEDRRSNLSTILNKARKQNINTRSTSVSSASTSEDSLDNIPSAPPSPNPPLLPHELSQVDFLSRMGLCTHEVFKELQNKRVERKRRSTANPHFLYGNTKCKWDQGAKRKKNTYLISSLSPPNTRQAVKNKRIAEQRNASPPNSSESRSSSPSKTIPVGFPNIPNLPSGLTIERISYGNRSSPDNKVCVICRQSGALLICETCNSNYHVTCHNRPLVQQPKHCPKCLNKKEVASRDVGSLNVPPSMTVLATYVSAEVKEKIEEKKALIESIKTTNEEIEQLEEHHNNLSVRMKEQKEEKEDLLNIESTTNAKIEKIIEFINYYKTNVIRPLSITVSEES